jgi:hypothetical protein
MESCLNAASYQSSSLLFVFILSLSLGLGVVAIGPAGLSFTTFFLAITLLTPSKLIAHHSHGGNDLASMLESGSF